jgi:signal transduction histidine kinase
VNLLGSTRVLFLAGVLAVVGFGTPTLLWLLAATPFSAARLLTWIVAFVVFAVAFYLVAWPDDHVRPRRDLSLLVAQSVSALFTAFLVGSGFEGTLVAVVAGQLPFFVSKGVTAVWIVLQTAGLALAYWPWPSSRRALANVLGYLSLQAFAAGAAYLAASERQARRDLGRVNAELLATQGLLADNTRMAERLRIARELHDSLGHHLAALSVNLDLAGHVVEGEGASLVRQAHGLTKLLLADVREVVGSLRDEGAIDLATALRTLVAGIPRPEIHLAIPEGLAIREPAQAHALFRCVQEIVTNTLRHASARHLWIELAEGPDGLRVHARDDGRGASAVSPGHGIAGMQERVRDLGGRVELSSDPGRGFEVQVFLPAAASLP